MKITVYTITDCPFCKQEKDFLTAKGLQFEEKNVQDNRQFLTEMLDVSDKFAGVPFTLVEKDSGEKVGLKGFTQSEFEEVLGMTAGTMPQDTSAPVAPTDPMAATPADPVTPAAPAAPMDPTSAPAVTSSMPDAAPNMPSMPGIDEAPVVSSDSMSAPAAQVSPSMPSMDTTVPSMSPTPAPVTPTAPVADMSTTTSAAPANPQSQLDGVLSDLESKAQPELPDFNAPKQQ